MTSKITELRKIGRLDEAYELAKEELENEPNNIWSKRNMAWVLFSFLKKEICDNNIEKRCCIKYLKERISILKRLIL